MVATVRSIEVAAVYDDFIRFHASCSCGRCRQTDEGSRSWDSSPLIEQYGQFVTRQAFAKDKTKTLIVGCCSGASVSFVEKVLHEVTKLGVECMWLNWDQVLIDNIKTRLGVNLHHTSEDVPTWSEAVSQNNLAGLLAGVVNRAKDIEYQLIREEGLLQNFPFVCHLTDIRFEVDHLLRILFPELKSEYETKTHCVLLANPEDARCILVTKSEEYFLPTGEFMEPRQIIEELERGQFRSADRGLRVRIERGRWKVAPHPPIDYSDPNFRYVPMWQRIVRA